MVSTDDSAQNRRAARGGVANLIGAAYSGVASFVITAVVTRISSTQDAGVYFSAVSIMLIVITLTQVGTPVGYVYFLARHRGLGQTDRLRATITAGALPVLALTGVIITVAIVFRDALGSLLFGPDVQESGANVLIIAGALLIALSADGALAITRGLGTMRPTVVTDKFLNPTTQLITLLLLAAIGWTGSEELVFTRVAGFVMMAIVAVPWARRCLKRFPPPRGGRGVASWSTDKDTLRTFWKFSGPRAIGQFAQVGIQRVDIVLVALWLRPSDAAIYAAATRFLVFGQLAARSISVAIQPQISSLAARGNLNSLQSLYRVSTAWIIFATWPIYLTFLLHADLLMHIFGPEYAAGATVLRILALSMLFATACGAVDAVLVMAGRSDLTMINAWVALIANLGLNIWLIPRLGILGATIAWTASIVVANALPLLQVKVTLGLHPFGSLPSLASASTLVLFFAVPGTVIALRGTFAVTAVVTLTCGLVYTALIWQQRRRIGIDGILGRPRQ